MSEAGRKDFSTKAKESMTPDSSKSTGEKLKETFTDTTDKAARGLQTDSSKSTTQEVSDKAGRMKDNNAHGGAGESILDKTKNALGMGDKHT
ncbi:putative chaperone/heat shock protein Hsp12 [Cryomyces antarcticus]